MSDSAVSIIVSGLITVVTMIVGVFTLWIKMKYETKKVSDKVDTNTVLTKTGTASAAINAQAAVVAARSAETKTDDIAKQLNGKLEEKIETTVRGHTESVLTALREHAAQDDANMKEIREAIQDLKK